MAKKVASENGIIKTRNAVVSAAQDCFSTFGFEGTKVDFIAQKSGVNKRIIYEIFSSKDELYSTLLSGLSHEMEENFNQLLKDIPMNIRGIYEAFFNFMNTQKIYVRMWAWEMMNPSLPGMWILNSNQKVFDELNEFIIKNSEKGQLPPINKKALDLSISFIHGLLVDKALDFSVSESDIEDAKDKDEKASHDAMMMNVTLNSIENLILAK